MTKKKKQRTDPSALRRVSFPEDEKKNLWLSRILDSYHVVDRGVASATEAQKKRGRILACGKGCHNCCSTHKDIPVYPHELKGIIWYSTEKISGPLREILKSQLRDFTNTDPCPFLIEGNCVIHPVRPMACRQFNVFDRPCEKGEDPYYSRRQDVMDPVKKYVDQAFIIMLPFYGVEKESERIRIVETGSMHKMVRELHACRWNELAKKMQRLDNSTGVQ